MPLAFMQEDFLVFPGFDHVFLHGFFIGSQEVIDAARWFPGEPNGRNTQLCADLQVKSALLRDVDCWHLQKYIC